MYILLFGFGLDHAYVFVSLSIVGAKGESVIWGPMDDNALQNDGGREKANTGCPKDKRK